MKLLIAFITLSFLLAACNKNENPELATNYKQVTFQVFNNVASALTDTAQLTVSFQVYAQPDDSINARPRLLWDSTLTQRRSASFGGVNSPFQFTRRFNNVDDSREQLKAIATVRRLATPNQPDIKEARTIRSFLSLTFRVPL